MSIKHCELGSTLPSLLAGLVDRAADNLTHGELQHLASFSEVAHMQIQRLGCVAEGVALLVQNDAQAATPAGNFQTPESVSLLLLALADMAAQADALLTMGQHAEGVMESRSMPAAAAARRPGKGATH